MKVNTNTDYETYLEVMEELLMPINSAGIDVETLKRLYESKYVYLENLRIKCFLAINSGDTSGGFQEDDYEIILEALKQTKKHIKDLIIASINQTMAGPRVSNQ